MTIKAEERNFLLNIREKCELLAEDLKKAGELGYVVGFNLNAGSGQVDNWNVQKLVGVTLELDS